MQPLKFMQRHPVHASAWYNLLCLPVILEFDAFLLSCKFGSVDFAACIFLDISLR